MRITTLTTALVLGATTTAAFGWQATFVPLGFLPGGSLSRAYAVDRFGTTVVGESLGQAFRWTAAFGMSAVPSGGGVTPSIAWGVSASGSEVVGVGGGPTFPHAAHAFRWTAGQGTQDLGPGYAHGISATGFHVVGGDAPGNTSEAFVWHPASGQTLLGMLPGHTHSDARGVGPGGLVAVGGSSASAGPQVAFRWARASGMIALGFLPGGSGSRADDLSDDGSVVVGESWSSTTDEAFRWTAGTGMVGLGFLPGGALSAACGVSGDGDTVVGWSENAFGTYHAFIWTQSLGMVGLRDRLISDGATGLAGWDLRFAKAISESGNAVVGYGINPTGQQEAFIAYLNGPPSSVISVPVCTPGVANSTLFSGVMVATGSRVVADNDVTIEMRNIPIGAFGFFLNSMSLGAPVVPPASEGRLCLTGGIGRHVGPGQVMAAVQGPWPGAFGVISLQLDLTAMPTPTGSVTVVPGDTWYFQGWYRGTPESIFSTGVSIQFL